MQLHHMRQSPCPRQQHSIAVRIETVKGLNSLDQHVELARILLISRARQNRVVTEVVLMSTAAAALEL